jgi:hypothetical protein
VFVPCNHFFSLAQHWPVTPGAYPKRKHLKGAPKEKPSSFLGLVISDEGKKFYNIDTRPTKFDAKNGELKETDSRKTLMEKSSNYKQYFAFKSLFLTFKIITTVGRMMKKRLL